MNGWDLISCSPTRSIIVSTMFLVAITKHVGLWSANLCPISSYTELRKHCLEENANSIQMLRINHQRNVVGERISYYSFWGFNFSSLSFVICHNREPSIEPYGTLSFILYASGPFSVSYYSILSLSNCVLSWADNLRPPSSQVHPCYSPTWRSWKPFRRPVLLLDSTTFSFSIFIPAIASFAVLTSVWCWCE